MLKRPLLSLLACALLLVLLAACSARAEDFGPVVNAFEQSRLEDGAHEMYRVPGDDGVAVKSRHAARP